MIYMDDLKSSPCAQRQISKSQGPRQKPLQASTPTPTPPLLPTSQHTVNPDCNVPQHMKKKSIYNYITQALWIFEKPLWSKKKEKKEIDNYHISCFSACTPIQQSSKSCSLTSSNSVTRMFYLLWPILVYNSF